MTLSKNIVWYISSKTARMSSSRAQVSWRHVVPRILSSLVSRNPSFRTVRSCCVTAGFPTWQGMLIVRTALQLSPHCLCVLAGWRLLLCHLLLTANKMTVWNNHTHWRQRLSRASPGLSSYTNNAFGMYVIQIREPDLEMSVAYFTCGIIWFECWGTYLGQRGRRGHDTVGVWMRSFIIVLFAEYYSGIR